MLQSVERSGGLFDETSLERVRQKLRSAELDALVSYWDALRADRSMPACSDVDPSDLKRHAPRLILADVLHEPLRFRLRLVGAELEDKLGRRMTDTILTDETPMFFKPYAACVTGVRATREFLSFDFGGGEPAGTFERILLPLSEDGETVSGILGEAIYTNLATDPSQLM